MKKINYIPAAIISWIIALWIIKNKDEIVEKVKNIINYEEKEIIQKIWKDWILFSRDPQIRLIQEKYWINHINKTRVDKNWNIIFGIQKNRITPFLKTPKWSLQIIYDSNEKIQEWLRKGILIDASKIEKRSFDIKNDILSSWQTIATIDTISYLERISKRFLEKTWHKIQITSFLRTEEENSKLSNSSKNSSHLRWSAIDISIKRVLDKNWKYVRLNENMKRILINILKEEDINWNSIFVEENNHFHISILWVNWNINTLFNYNKIRWWKRIKISEYLDNKSIDITTKIIIQDIFTKAQIDFSKLSERQKEQIYENTINLIKYIVHIESSWWEFLENDISSAKWPFQIIDWYKNWVRHKNFQWKWNFTTFEVWLRNYIKYTNDTISPIKSLRLQPDWVEKALDSKWKISPNQLTEEQNINLFLVWTFLWDKKEKAEDFIKIIILWDKSTLEKVYINHHTNPDEQTKNLMNKSMELYWEKIINILNL